MDKLEFNRLQALAKAACIKFHCEELSDDLTQEAYLAYSRGRKTTVEKICIDLIRREYGSTRIHGNIERQSDKPRGKARFKSIEALQDRAKENGCDIVYFIPALRTDPIDLASDCGNEGQLRDAARFEGCATIVDYLDGAKNQEIAFTRGVSESRISQILKKERERIERSLVLDVFLPSYRENKEASKLSIQWIAI